MTIALMIHAALKLATVYKARAYIVSNPQDHILIYYVMLG